jgi:hypothetical protein
MYLLQELVCFIFKAGRRASMIAKINGFEHKKLVIDRISVRLTCDQWPYAIIDSLDFVFSPKTL